MADGKIYCREEGVVRHGGRERRVRRNASWVPSMVRRRGPDAAGGGGGGMADGSGYVALSPAWRMRGVMGWLKGGSGINSIAVRGGGVE